MFSVAADPSTHSYFVFRYVTDPTRAMSVPAGVALWETGTPNVLMRFIEDDEAVTGVSSAEARQFIGLTEQGIRKWVDVGQLPYQPEGMSPHTTEWWNHMRELLAFKVSLSEPLPIDCVDPIEELEPLFEAVVGPRAIGVKRHRIDGLIANALGATLSRFDVNQPVSGYRGRHVTVRRLCSMPGRQVIAEGVNLASPDNAERDADALTSRMLRVREAADQTETHFVIGYQSSPSGLNGETALKEWIESRLRIRLYDLLREKDAYQQMAAELTSGYEAQQRLLPPAE